MQIDKFFIQREYKIICKIFRPEKANIKSVVIGVHGFAGDKESSMLNRLAETIVESGSILICFDFPSHGESPVNESELTVENCKKDLLAVAKYVNTKYPNTQKSIFATSFGGYISLLCYDMLSDFKFVLRAPAITMPSLLLNNVLKISADAFKTQGFVDCGFERKIRLPYSFYTELQEQEDLLNKDYQRPIHIFYGDMDDIVPPEIILAFSNKHKSTEVFLIKGADHRFKNPGEIDTIVSTTKKILAL